MMKKENDTNEVRSLASHAEAYCRLLIDLCESYSASFTTPPHPPKKQNQFSNFLKKCFSNTEVNQKL